MDNRDPEKKTEGILLEQVHITRSQDTWST